MDEEKAKSEFQLLEERMNSLWAKIEAREALETKLGESISTANNQLAELDKKIEAASSKSSTFNEKAASLEADYQQKVTELDEKRKSVDSLLGEVRALHDNYFKKDESTSKSKADVLTEHHNSIETFQKSSQALKKEIEDFRDFIYGNEEAKVPGFKKDAARLVDDNKKLMDDWGKNYGSLKDKIESLLPGATSAGLAQAFYDQKNTYRLFIWLWSAIFVVTVVAMIVAGFYFFTIDMQNSSIKPLTFADTLIHILARLPFFLPAVWLAIFAGKKQNQNTRLQQEYSYKESLAKSYEANRREIDSLPEGDAKTELLVSHLSTIVNMLGYNPSATLEHQSHHEKTPVEEIANKVLAALRLTKSDKGKGE